MQKHKLGILLGLITVIILLLYFAARSGIGISDIQSIIKGSGYLAPIVFILIYTIGPIFFMPITPLSVTAGILFGPVWGTIYTVIGATSGACATFLVSRYLMKDWIDKRSHDKVVAIQKRVQEEGWKFIMIARITPIFPFNVQNYVFGVTNVSLRTFFWATLVSLIPGSFTYVYLGYAGKSAFKNGSGAIYQIAAAVIMLLIISFLPYIIKFFKKIIKKKKEVNKSFAKL